VSFVHADSRPATASAIEHLIGLGHRRIAIAINGVPDSDHADRFAGYRDALRMAGINFDDRLVFQAWASPEGGAQVVRQLIAVANPPTAVYLTDPMAAAGAMLEARRIGMRVPGDLSIIGFDDGRMRFMTSPNMTAVCQDATTIGRAALDVLLELIAGSRSSSTRRVLPTWFEVHESTAAPSSRVTASANRTIRAPRKRRSPASKE
jgi:DNA-binding LacI/PurR family transcriptional regulator